MYKKASLCLVKKEERVFMDKIPQEYEIPLYLFHNGTNYETYRFLGCHKGTKDGNDGYYFRVWAAKARAVSLVGDFNNWDDNATPMQQIEKSEEKLSGIIEPIYEKAIDTAEVVWLR